MRIHDAASSGREGALGLRLYRHVRSLIATAKLNNVEPSTWLRDVLQRMTDVIPPTASTSSCLELAAHKRQGIGHVQEMDAYESNKSNCSTYRGVVYRTESWSSGMIPPVREVTVQGGQATFEAVRQHGRGLSPSACPVEWTDRTSRSDADRAGTIACRLCDGLLAHHSEACRRRHLVPKVGADHSPTLGELLR
jgi:IS66 C-terminal element